MTPNETDAQVNAQNEANNTSVLQNEAASNSSKEIGSSTSLNISDRAIESKQEDLIGIEDLQDGLVNYIKRSNNSFTIALQGEWGLGKTSFLNLLEINLCGTSHNKSMTIEEGHNDSLFQTTQKHNEYGNTEHPYYSVWIDTCKFTLLNSPTDAVIYMLQSMVYQISHFNIATEFTAEGNKYIEKGKEKGRTIIKNLGKFIAKKAMVHGATVLTGGLFAGKTIETVADLICDPLFSDNKQQQNSTISIVDQLQVEIEDLIKDVLENYNPQNKDGIVFFIDNLDRIDPRLAVEILDITKNIFDFKDYKCIFIIGVDNNILLRGLQAKLGPLDKNNAHIFQAYIDKFVQISINLGYQGTAVTNLLFQSLKEIHYFNDNELDSFKKDDLDLKKVLTFFFLLSASCNPRSVKRFANTLSLVLSIKEARNRNLSKLINKNPLPIDTITKSLIFVIACTVIFNRSLFDIISNKPIFIPYNSQDQDQDQDQSSTEDILNDIRVAVCSIDQNNTKLHKQAIPLLQSLLSIEKLSNNKNDFNQKLGEALELTIYLHTKLPFPN